MPSFSERVTVWICSKLKLDLLESLFIMLGFSHTNEDWGVSKGFLGSFCYFKKRKDQFIGQKEIAIGHKCCIFEKKGCKCK